MGNSLDGEELMRLACPNCDARYEVPDGAIPESGRDVQCSNCGHAWFQLPDAPAEAAELPAEPAPAPPAAAAPALPPAAEPARATLDDSVLSILREEAERETEARRQEAQRAAARRAEAEEQLQIQPELGLAAPPPAPVAAAATGGAAAATDRRLKTLKGEEAEAAAPAHPSARPPARPPARRDLLPNVDDINSTLQPDDTRPPEAEVDSLPDLTRGRAFRSGFFLAVFALVVAGVIYVSAPAMQATVPALKAPLEAYVGFVDGLRARLDSLMDSATDRLNGDPGQTP